MTISLVGYVMFWACVVLLGVQYLEMRFGRLIRRLLAMLLEDDAPEEGHVKGLRSWLKEHFRRVLVYNHHDV